MLSQSKYTSEFSMLMTPPHSHLDKHACMQIRRLVSGFPMDVRLRRNSAIFLFLDHAGARRNFDFLHEPGGRLVESYGRFQSLC